MASVVLRKAKELDMSEQNRRALKNVESNDSEDAAAIAESWGVVRAIVGQRHESNQQYAIATTLNPGHSTLKVSHGQS